MYAQVLVLEHELRLLWEDRTRSCDLAGLLVPFACVWAKGKGNSEGYWQDINVVTNDVAGSRCNVTHHGFRTLSIKLPCMLDSVKLKGILEVIYRLSNDDVIWSHEMTRNGTTLCSMMQWWCHGSWHHKILTWSTCEMSRDSCDLWCHAGVMLMSCWCHDDVIPRLCLGIMTSISSHPSGMCE